MKVAAGIDVGKAQLDVSVAAGAVRRFANSATGITALVRWLESEDVTVAVCEPTGGYERQVVNRLWEALPAVVLAHPNKVRAFARPAGRKRRPIVSMHRCCRGTAPCLNWQARRHHHRTATFCEMCCSVASNSWHNGCRN